ncbi:unnamed protein product [Didymodactylos carnosus]|uniref:Serine/threonine-protein kinase RIO3 n=1 Tax=Didymodactylos carnosus TaxID=1234261 RepID=A0A814FRL6_9BILA|nr:unnamed protein product [Didymodactylos carnosus]CAF0987307.1 unnamed protein product [Didymodactylos carnosus]CAF3569585.1 unnamed protein product [Didymodactylos carnosus]CAF3759469.1 unnamed protein product [Didymodactylos carnosus]
MDSDLAQQLQNDEDRKLALEINRSMPVETEITLSESPPIYEELVMDNSTVTPSVQQSDLPTENNDYLVALMLQKEYNDEFNNMVKRYETTMNKNSKVKLSMKNYMLLSSPQHNDSKIDEDDVIIEKEEAFSDNEIEEKVPSFNKRGTSGKGASMVTKHNPVICGKRNVSKIMNTFPPEFDTGDGITVNLQLSNKIYNELKTHSLAEERRMTRLHDKVEKATASLAFDPKTRIILYKMLNSCVLDELGSIIATGKESIVLYGKGGKTEAHNMPPECAIKVFKTTLNEFRTREKYLRHDHPFKYGYKHWNPRRIIKLWAKKEMFNLQCLLRAGILCPRPVLLKKHVLILSFIGENGVPAQRLRDITLNQQDLLIAYQQCLELLRRIYHDCKLIHADFSEYNLLWFKNNIWVIDVAQSVEQHHPHAYEYLLRDCTNVSTYFRKHNRDENTTILSPEEIFNYVTDLKFEKKGQEFLAEIVQHVKNIRSQLEAVEEKDNFSFEYFFNKSANIDDETSSSSSEEEDVEKQDTNNDDENYVDISSDDEQKIIQSKCSRKKLTCAPRKLATKHL